jgi:hypothetical protein
VGALALALAGLAGATLSGPVGSTPAGADPLPDCSTTVGVVVAVDLSPWGGAVERGCDATLTSALDALQADFTVTGTAQYGDAFICQINGQPAAQTCQSTPPASASWSFWYADVGQSSWTYSSEGAATLRPAAGSVEAWTFGAAQATPEFSPGQVRATNVSPAAPGSAPTTTTSAPPPAGTGATPTTTVAGAPAAGGAAPGGSSSTGGSSTSTTAAGAGGSPSASGPSTSASTTTTTDAGSRSGAASGATTTTTTTDAARRDRVRIIDATPADVHRRAPGSPVPLLLGLTVVAVVAAIAVVIARRRRPLP